MPENRTRRPRRQATAVVEAGPPPVEDGERIDGALVVEVGPVVQRGKEVPGRELLTMEDGTQQVRCVDCGYLGTNTAVAVHRGRTHDAGDPAAALPTEVLSMTVGELLHLAGGIAEWESAFSRQQQDHEAAMQKVQDALAEEKSTRRQAEMGLRRLERMFDRAGFRKVEAE